MTPHPLAKWLVAEDDIRFSGETVWLSDTVWMVKERFEFSSGYIKPRTMFVQIMTPNRLHVTADDMPLGADILLHENGFRFTPYYIWSQYKGKRWRLKCLDENLVDETGVIHDTIKMFLFGFHVSTMRLTVTVDRNEG